MNDTAIRRGMSALGTLIGGALLMTVLLLASAQQVRAQEEEDFKECVDAAFADYNSCLMGSDWWLERLVCDLDWELETVECVAEALGQIRGAFEPH